MTSAIMRFEYSIVLFDGVCNFCNRTVNFVIARDVHRRFKFAALQSDAGQRILRERGLPAEGINSFLLLENGLMFDRSTAALRVLRRLGGAWSLGYVLVAVPSVVRDAVYNFIAVNRYKWFGQRDSCSVPTPEMRQRFLD